MTLKKYSFNNTKTYWQFINVSGIYALIHNDEVIYVGKSKNVQSRLKSHHTVNTNISVRLENKNKTPGILKQLSFYQYLKDNMEEIEFIVLPTPEAELNTTEYYYIKKYKPKFNYSGVVEDYTPNSKKVRTEQ